MDIVVCIKQVPGTSKIKINKDTNTLVRKKKSSIINPYDMYAIEEAVQLKEKYKGNVTAVSMGIPSVKTLLKEAVALGADKGVLLSDKLFAGSDTLATAYTLSKCIKKLDKYDIILCGKQAVDGDTGQVGPALAKKLNINHITNVKKIEKIRGNKIICQRLTEDGYERIETILPALITVVKQINIPRLPSIKSINKAEKTDITLWSFKDIDADIKRLGLKGSPTRVVGTFFPKHETKCEMITGTSKQKADKLFKKLKIGGV